MLQVGEAPGSEMVEPQAASEENVSQKATWKNAIQENYIAPVNTYA